MKITEEQLRDMVRQSLSEALDEIGFGKRFGQWARNAWDNAKTQVGGAAAGLKAGIKYGGANAASAGRNDYMAKRNADLAQSRSKECEEAIAEFRKEYGKKVGELNQWKANEIAQIKKMYGADAFAKKAGDAQAAAGAARDSQAQFWGNQQQNSAQAGQTYDKVAESVAKALKKVLAEAIAE